MNQDIKQLWVAALRSGEFQQGRARLKNESTGTFCCLGVLCELHDRQKSCEQSYESYAGELPEHVREWAGLKESNPYMYRTASDAYLKSYMTHISFLNDIEKLDFNQIADLIETQL